MELYNVPYICVFILFFLLLKYENNNGNRNNVRLIAAGIFILFYGFRGYIGTDWFNYNTYYEQATLKTWSESDYELGFAFLSKLLHDIGVPYLDFVFIIVVLQVFLWDRVLKLLNLPIALSYIILISIFPLLVIDLLRNFTSILIALQGVAYLIRGEKKGAISYFLLSILFHTTGIFFFFLFFIRKTYLNKKVAWVLTCVGLVFYFLQLRVVDNIIELLGGFVGGRVEYLADSAISSEQGYGIRFGIIEKLIFLFIVLFNYDSLTNNKKISPLIINAFFIYIFIQLYFSTIDAFVNRFSLLFFWSYLFVLVKTPQLVSKKYNFSLLKSFILLLCFFKIYITYNNILYSYKNTLLSEDSIREREWNRAQFYMDR